MLFRLIFLIISTLGIMAALGTVLARNLVRSALFLIAFFFCVACQFVLLEAEFLAAVQVMVYIGAIAVIILFGIMLTRDIQGDETTISSLRSIVLGGLISLGLLAILGIGIQSAGGVPGRPSWSAAVRNTPAVPVAEGQPLGVEVETDVTRIIGLELMSRYVVAFELAGVLLTAAVVGAIAVALADAPGPKPAASQEAASAAAGSLASDRRGPALVSSVTAHGSSGQTS